MNTRGKPESLLYTMDAGGGETVIDLGTLNPKQALFFRSMHRFTAYGGARGGGKSWAARRLAAYFCLTMPGLSVLMMRRRYLELEENHIAPLKSLLPGQAAQYSGAARTFSFFNGSRLRFGHLHRTQDLNEYQGLEFDMIFIDEATQFTEAEFRTLAACLRGVNEYPKRLYLTCNPGGVGHDWVKRLFVTREYQNGERPGDYAFIPATVDDNAALMKASPDYVRMLELLPEDIRRAHRYGDWDALSGRYFSEFRQNTHTCAPFLIPDTWRKYRAIDYGLDMTACLWFAVSPKGWVFVYREVSHSGLIVSDAARLILDLTPANEQITATFAPPDLWSTQKDTGRTMAAIFAASGLALLRASSARRQGWLSVKEYLKPDGQGKPKLLIFSQCRQLIANIGALMHDEKNPDDCAASPHDITHDTDALRYFCVSHILCAQHMYATRADQQDEEAANRSGFDAFMRGGRPDESFLYA